MQHSVGDTIEETPTSSL